MRYIIIGAGAVGGAIGGRLHQAGHDVVLVARGEHATALREKGLRLRTPDEDVTLRAPVATGPDEVEPRPDDVLLLTVKTQDTVAALDAWAPAAAHLPLLCVQNGVANEEIALRRFARVYGVCVWLPAQYLEPGVITASAAPLTGMLHIGRYPQDGTTDDTARAVSADLESARFLAPVVPDVMRWKYAKLLSNLGNAVQALCGMDQPDSAELLRRARAEGEAVLAAAGIPFAGEEEQAELRGDRVNIHTVPGTERGGGSTWQSLRRGTGSVEVDYLNGEIVLLGRHHGVPAPVNEALRHGTNVLAREGRPPGSTSAAELLASLPS
ncbi:ketopantoate reductase family protein [Streptomyces avicenniae]|uniref:ketopantoate reductase family protein n=1 Tax=Streptomyces avicenniae TaxID=500153 RepID=UPI00069A6981|nr:2-dehydropantoate 2-reductase [Streptomyces avicenniae]